MLTIAGYPTRGNPILGLVVQPRRERARAAADGKPYTTLGYANGPGFPTARSRMPPYPRGRATGRAQDLSAVDTTLRISTRRRWCRWSETHGGEDVAIYAGGPAHLFHGVQEQSYVFHVMRAALGL